MKSFVRPLLALTLATALPFAARADQPAAPAPAASAEPAPLRAKETFAVVWERLQNSGFKGQHEGLDWAALKAAHQPDIENAQDLETLRREIGELLAALKASHLQLIPANAFPKSDEAPKAGTGDLGVRLLVLDRRIVVERVVPGSSADAAGVRPGWTVEKIGGFDLAKVFAGDTSGQLDKPRGRTILQMTANTLVSAVADGSEVSLQLRTLDGDVRSVPLIARTSPNTRTVTLPGLPPMPLRFERRAIPLRGGGCALYVEFSQWALPVYASMIEALRAHGDCHGVVLDLRGNSGGLIASMGAVGGLFVDQPTHFGTMITAGGELKLTALPREVDDTGADILRFGGPLAILTDRGSISCSDMFAGGMQATGRARIFGDVSAGMALPSTSIRLPSGDNLLYPTADYVDPKGRRIEGVGVIPDTPSAPTAASLRDGRDAALEAALAWIRKSR